MTTLFGGVALARTNLPSRGLSGRIATISVFWNLMFSGSRHPGCGRQELSRMTEEDSNEGVW
jgi:hypothetical protein